MTCLRRIWLLLTVLFFGTGTLGCGGPSVDTTQCLLTGTVTYKGKPVYGGMITVEGPTGDLHYGEINLEGKYRVGDAPLGEVKIAVISTKPTRPVDRRGPKAPPPADPSLWFPVDEKYANVNSSGITAKLNGGKMTHDIELN